LVDDKRLKKTEELMRRKIKLVFDQLTSKKKEFLSRTLSSIPEPKHQFRELVKTPLVRKNSCFVLIHLQVI